RSDARSSSSARSDSDISRRHLGEEPGRPPPAAPHLVVDDAAAVDAQDVDLVGGMRHALFLPGQGEIDHFTSGDGGAMDLLELPGVGIPAPELGAHGRIAAEGEPPVGDRGVDGHLRSKGIAGLHCSTFHRSQEPRHRIVGHRDLPRRRYGHHEPGSLPPVCHDGAVRAGLAVLLTACLTAACGTTVHLAGGPSAGPDAANGSGLSAAPAAPAPTAAPGDTPSPVISSPAAAGVGVGAGPPAATLPNSGGQPGPAPSTAAPPLTVGLTYIDSE